MTYTDVIERLRTHGKDASYFAANAMEDAVTMFHSVAAELAAMTARAEAAEATTVDWQRALMKLTPGGSEYTTPEAVAAFVERERADRHDARTEKVAAIKRAITAEAQVADLTAKLGAMTGALNEAQYGLSWALARDRDANPPYCDDPCPPVTRGLNAVRAALKAGGA